MMAQLGEWLDTIGVGRYAALLAEHDIDFQVLPELGEADLEKLGISLGHRKHALQYDADPGVTLHSYASWALHAIGLLDQALRQNDRALALADASSNPYSLVEAMTFRAQLAFMRRDPEEALRFAEAALRMSKEHHCPVYAALSRVPRGWAFALEGDGVRGVAEMSEGLAAAAEVGMLNEFAFARPTMLGEALAKLGQVPQALTVVDQAIDFIARTNSRPCEAEA